MELADLVYEPVCGPAGLPIAVAIHADRARIRDELREDAEAAGLAVRACGPLAELTEGDARPLGDLVLIDCPEIDAALLAALARIDMRAAHCGARLIVSTSIAGLDDVFACCDRSGPQILVDPSRAERLIALGRLLARTADPRLRELAEADRLTLLRLTQQVGEIAERLDRISAPLPGISGDLSPRFESPGKGYRAGGGGEGLRAARPPLPDPRLVRRMVRERKLRERFFDGALFADPAWDILLDLTVARAEHTRVSVTSLCIASGVPPTTALRWIGHMTAAGLLERHEDHADRRRAFVALSDRTADAMARYFAQLRRGAGGGA